MPRRRLKQRGADEEGFIRWLCLLRDFCSARAPYQTPRLASVTIREEQPDERREYPTLHDMEIELTKSGLPIEHLKRLTIEHRRIEKEDAEDGGAGGSSQ